MQHPYTTGIVKISLSDRSSLGHEDSTTTVRNNLTVERKEQPYNAVSCIPKCGRLRMSKPRRSLRSWLTILDVP